MKRIVFFLVLFAAALLSACQAQPTTAPQNTPASNPAPQASPTAQRTPILPPADATTVTITARFLSSVDGKPYPETPVFLAEVYRNGESAAFALDLARSPSRFTDSEGYVVFSEVTINEFVIVVGDPQGKYFIVNEENDDNTARVFKADRGKVQQLGDLVIDFAP